jgi:HAE1 family hydrophobic/amphiphilic exporter-1
MIRQVIQRPIAISMFFLALVLLGVLSYNKLPVDLLPSITYPRLTVTTTYEAIPAEDLERLVTQPLEEVVTALTGVRRVTSRTREGVSMITVEYEWGTQMDFANLHLREAVDRVAYREDFPEDAERPVILRWDPTSRPIAVLALEGDEPVAELTEFAEEVVKPALQQVDGISKAEVVGGSIREILVEPDLERMGIYGITVEQIQLALARSNISFPGGRIRQGPLQMSLRIDGEFDDLEEILETDIVRPGQSPVRISDVARVIDTIKEPEGVTLLNGSPVVSLLVYKEPEANTIHVSDEADVALGVLKEDYGEFDYSYVYRDAEYVKASFSGLLQSLIFGAGLAFLVLFFFLRDMRSPVVVGLSIPVSIVTTFTLLYFGKVKLNLMSLGGLSLAAGMLVDNAIVVLENINRHIGEKLGKKDKTGEVEQNPAEFTSPQKKSVAGCAEIGTKEVARPVLAATLTTIAVFFPVVYVPGIAGAFFRDQALTVTFSLMVSVTVALLLQPMLSARVLKARKGPAGGLFRVFALLFDRFHGFYHGVLVRALGRPRVLLVGLAVALIAAVGLGYTIDRSFMPERSGGDLRLELEMPNGTPLEETATSAAALAEWIEADEAVATVFTQVGTTERTVASLKEYTAPNTAKMRIIMVQSRSARQESERVQELVSRRLQSTPDVRYAFREEGVGLSEILSTGEAPFSLGIIAEDPVEAVEVAEQVLTALSQSERLRDLQVDRVIGTPNVVVHLDAEEILRAGLDPDVIARDLRNRIAGVEATTFNEVEKRIDIAVRFAPDTRRNLAAMLNSPIELAGGETVPIRRFLSLAEERPVRELSRDNQRRMVTISGDLSGASLDAAWSEADRIVAAMNLPPDVKISAGGEREAMVKSFRDLLWAMMLAVVLVYMILAAQFESFVDPLLIAAVLPIGIAGSFIAIGVTGNTVNILSLIGMVALTGIAVNDAIIKVDTMRRLRAEGMQGYDAILRASDLRLRPIIMTSVTTILAMVPMAIGLGSGEQLQRPLALTIIGGLFLTTALTLFYTPILYMVAHKIRRPVS